MVIETDVAQLFSHGENPLWIPDFDTPLGA